MMVGLSCNLSSVLVTPLLGVSSDHTRYLPTSLNPTHLSSPSTNDHTRCTCQPTKPHSFHLPQGANSTKSTTQHGAMYGTHAPLADALPRESLSVNPPGPDAVNPSRLGAFPHQVQELLKTFPGRTRACPIPADREGFECLS